MDAAEASPDGWVSSPGPRADVHAVLTLAPGCQTLPSAADVNV
jgi:hypothetical protein